MNGSFCGVQFVVCCRRGRVTWSLLSSAHSNVENFVECSRTLSVVAVGVGFAFTISVILSVPIFHLAVSVVRAARAVTIATIVIALTAVVIVALAAIIVVALTALVLARRVVAASTTRWWRKATTTAGGAVTSRRAITTTTRVEAPGRGWRSTGPLSQR